MIARRRRYCLTATLLAIVLRTLCLLVATLSLADFSGTGRAWWPLQDTSGDMVQF